MMFAAIQQFYRRNFCAVAKAELLELFDRSPDLRKAAILVETAPLPGIRVIYVWQELREVGQLTVRELDLKTAVEKTIAKRDLPKTAVAGVIRRLEQAAAHIGNYSGKARDGVYYSLCWGYPSEMSVLSINNPQIGSKPHEELVKMIRDLAAGEE
jgi:hypothetical protein